MQKLFVMLILGTSLYGCGDKNPENAPDQPLENTIANGDGNINYPFTATYSSSFEMGDYKNAKVVLDTWKAWQDNQLDDSRSSYADSVQIQFEDGSSFNGSLDSLIATAKIARSKFISVKDTLIAMMPLRSKDKNHEWVLLYGVEYTIDTKGKADTTQFHQVWRMKNHKAEYMARFKAIHR